MYIMGCIWQPLWILGEKVGICSYWQIIVEPPQHPMTWHPKIVVTDSYESSYMTGLTCNVMLELIVADQMADIPPHTVQGIMGCILWDVFASHCGFLKKRWEFAFISQ